MRRLGRRPDDRPSVWRFWQLAVVMVCGSVALGPSHGRGIVEVLPASTAPPYRAAGFEPLRVLTLNVFGLPWPLGRDVAARCARIAARLSADGADIVALQEAWDDTSRSVLLLDGYHCARGASSRTGIDPTGLVTLSRLPILEAAMLHFSRSAGLDALVDKGALHTRHDLGGGAVLDVFNVHLQSYGERSVRLAQVEELADWVRARAGDGPVVVLGDFNCGPGDPEFERMLQLLPAPLSRTGVKATYDASSNPLAEPEPPCCIDHVLVAGRAAELRCSRLVFVHAAGEQPFSDHYGVETGIAWPR